MYAYVYTSEMRIYIMRIHMRFFMRRHKCAKQSLFALGYNSTHMRVRGVASAKMKTKIWPKINSKRPFLGGEDEVG